MAVMAANESDQQEVIRWLEATWLLSAWLHDDAWRGVTLDDVLMKLDNWPKPVADAVPQMRVDWAKAMAAERADLALEEELSEKDAMDVADDVNEQGDGGLATDAPSISEDMNVGERGIHLGWFRNPPQVGILPQGTRLVHAEGSQGLKRWVLLMEDFSGKAPGQLELTSWLGSVGVPDAYEVQWDGLTWGRLNSGSESDLGSSTPVSATDANVEAIWAAGEHVDLAMLDGTWHAIQVGVFSGEPDEAWLSAVGERLVKEPLPDGRARWHVATSRDASSGPTTFGSIAEPARICGCLPRQIGGRDSKDQIQRRRLHCLVLSQLTNIEFRYGHRWRAGRCVHSVHQNAKRRPTSRSGDSSRTGSAGCGGECRIHQ